MLKAVSYRAYQNLLIVELLCAEGERAEPHTLENLVIHRSKKFWLSHDLYNTYTLKTKRVALLLYWLHL